MEKRENSEAMALLDSEDKKLFVGEMEPREKGGKGEMGEVEERGALTAARVPWQTGLFDCCSMTASPWQSTDWEICAVGMFAPCVLYGSNRERLGSAENQFSQDCLLYFVLSLIGRIIFKCNVFAPFLSYPTRAEIRRKYSLQGNAELCLGMVGGCCGVKVDPPSESSEAFCDCCLHFFCHNCVLCQEARELRRRTGTLPGPAAMAALQGVQVMAPAEQAMA